MINQFIHGRGRVIKSHYNLSANDFVFTGTTALSIWTYPEDNFDKQRVTISVREEIWDKLLEKYPHLQERAEEAKRKKLDYIAFTDTVYACRENIDERKVIWHCGYQALGKKSLQAELRDYMEKAKTDKKKEHYKALLAMLNKSIDPNDRRKK